MSLLYIAFLAFLFDRTDLPGRKPIAVHRWKHFMLFKKIAKIVTRACNDFVDCPPAIISTLSDLIFCLFCFPWLKLLELFTCFCRLPSYLSMIL